VRSTGLARRVLKRIDFVLELQRNEICKKKRLFASVFLVRPAILFAFGARSRTLPSSRLAVRMKQLGFQWTDFDEI
jgi:hypothetical protein